MFGVLHQMCRLSCNLRRGDREPLAKRRKEHWRPESPVSEHITKESHIGSTGRMWRWGAMKKTEFGVAWLRQSVSLWTAHHWTGIKAGIPSALSTASCCRWRRPDVTGRKPRTFEDFALVWTFIYKFYHIIKCICFQCRWKIKKPQKFLLNTRQTLEN